MLVAVGATVAELSAGAVVGASSDSVDVVAGSAVEQAINTNAAAATNMAVNHALGLDRTIDREAMGRKRERSVRMCIRVGLMMDRGCHRIRSVKGLRLHVDTCRNGNRACR